MPVVMTAVHTGKNGAFTIGIDVVSEMFQGRCREIHAFRDVEASACEVDLNIADAAFTGMGAQCRLQMLTHSPYFGLYARGNSVTTTVVATTRMTWPCEAQPKPISFLASTSSPIATLPIHCRDDLSVGFARPCRQVARRCVALG